MSALVAWIARLGGLKLILAVLTALAGSGAMWLWHANGRLHQTIGGQQAALEAARAANHDALSTIQALRSANEDWVRRARQKDLAAQAQIEALEARYEDLALDEQEVRIERQVIYRDPSCAELAAIDVATVCPDLARSLRE